MRAAWIAVLLLIVPVWLGCAHETTVTTTTSTCIEPESEYVDDERECRVVEEVVVETESDPCHGLLSCTFVVVREVIALPFRIVGAAFDVVL